jgi:anti-sigma factor RsiW
MDCADFCARYGWSAEKYRKVAQRARARLRVLVDSHQSGERCRLLEPDIVAYASGALEPERSERVVRHLQNCRSCARDVHELERASREVAALLPAPAALSLIAKAGTLAKLAALIAGARRLVPFAGHGADAGTVTAGAGGGAFGAGGSLVGAGFAKLGVAAACVAGAAGGFALCSHAGLIGGGAAAHAGHVAATARVTVRDTLPRGGLDSLRPQLSMRTSARDIGLGRPNRSKSSGHRTARSQASLEFGSLVRGMAHATDAPSGVVAQPAASRNGGPAESRQRNELGFER